MTTHAELDAARRAAPHCDRDYACLSTGHACRVEPFLDRDVPLLRCLDERACAYRKRYLGRFICTCPVNRAAHHLN